MFRSAHRLSLTFCLPLLATMPLWGQETAKSPSACKSQRVAMFLTAVAQEQMPPDRRERFELRLCIEHNSTEVWGFETGAAKPSLVFDTGEGWPDQIVQVHSVLAIECSSPSLSFVHVFTFHKGRPQKVAGAVTKGRMSTRIYEDKAWNEWLRVRVPQYARGANGEYLAKPDRVISVPIEYGKN